MPNSAPAGTSLTLTVPRSYTLHKADFGFGDADGNGFKAVVVTTLPGAGTLYYDSNGSLGGGRTAVVAGQTISAADILAGKLTYRRAGGRERRELRSFHLPGAGRRRHGRRRRRYRPEPQYADLRSGGERGDRRRLSGA